MRNVSAVPILLLDAGNTLLGQTLAYQSEGRVVVDAMNAMGYDAMTVGPADLSRGMDVLLQRAQEASFAILSCNIVSAEDAKPILAPYTVIQRGGVRFGIIGVTEMLVPDASPKDLETTGILDPMAAVRSFLPEVRSRSDVVILLSHLGLEQDLRLAEAVPGIDIIVGGKDRKVMGAPERIAETVIVQMGYDGEWLGRLDVAFSPEGKITDAHVKVIMLRPDVDDDPELSALVNSYKERYVPPTPAEE